MKYRRNKACTQRKEDRLSSKKILEKLEKDKEFKRLVTHVVLIKDKDHEKRKKELNDKYFPRRVGVYRDYYFPIIKAIICAENGAKMQIKNKAYQDAYTRLEEVLQKNNITYIGEIQNKLQIARELNVPKKIVNIFLAYYFTKFGKCDYLNQKKRVKTTGVKQKAKYNSFSLINN